jgi:hypothetical protein
MKNVIVLLVITAASVATAFAQADIHRVDFNNFTYYPSCGGEDASSFTKIRVKNGRYSKATQFDGFTEHSSFGIGKTEFGDVTGDGKDEAVILSVCNTGGTGQFSEGFVYTIKAGKPSLLARIPGGDRADGGLRSIKVENGLLVVEYSDPDKAAGACCAEGIVIQKMRVSGGKVTDVGTPIKRDLYPKERISFTKGTSGKQFTVTIPVDDRKRYILGARAGQTLSVSLSGAGDLGMRLLDSDVSEISKRIDVRLTRSGDQTFEVSNYGAKPATVTITVRIK